MVRARHLLLVSLAVLVGCHEPVELLLGGSANYSASLGEDPDFSDPHGRIQVKIQWGDAHLSGFFADGPGLRYHTETERLGSCRLMTYSPSTCEPACSTEEACIDGDCVAWPARQDRGDLEWVWPDGQLTISPDPTLGYWGSGSATQGGDVTVSYEDITLEAPSIDPPDPDGDWADDISRRGDGDATLAWTNPVLDARVRVHMTDCVGSHGGIAPAEIECEGPDTGQLVIPGAFLDILEAGDWSHGECGSHVFARYHAAAPEGDTTIRMETIGDGGFFWRPDW